MLRYNGTRRHDGWRRARTFLKIGVSGPSETAFWVPIYFSEVPHLGSAERTKIPSLAHTGAYSDCQMTFMQIPTFKNIKVSTQKINLNDFYFIT